jgi:hypothetical protein
LANGWEYSARTEILCPLNGKSGWILLALFGTARDYVQRKEENKDNEIAVKKALIRAVAQLRQGVAG